MKQLLAENPVHTEHLPLFKGNREDWLNKVADFIYDKNKEEFVPVVARENIRLSEASAERSPDPTSADGGSMAFELEKELTLDENTRHLLNQVEHALVLIKKKKYGNCENCGEPIPVARLEALPYSSLCKNCAALIES